MDVLIVDGDNLARRNYHAQHLSTIDGYETGLIYGVISSLLALQFQYKAPLVVCVWDTQGGSKFRKALFPLYKASRQSDPSYVEQKEACQDLLDAMGVTQVSKPGAEADDIMGFLAKHTFKGKKVGIVSNDEDILQLIDEDIQVISPTKGPVGLNQYGKVTIEKQGKVIQLRPEQVVSFKAMVGDSSDEYPGIPQFGMAAAIAYFALNDSVDQLIAKEAKLHNQSSRALNHIAISIPLLPKFKALAEISMTEGAVDLPARPAFNMLKIRALFEEFEFKQFAAMGSRVLNIGGML